MNIKNYQKYVVVFGGFLLHLTIGNLYTYNNISPFVITFMQNRSLSQGDVSASNAVWILILSVFGLGASVTFGGIISAKIGPSLTVLFGGWFMSFNVMLMSFTISSYLSIVIISYGFLTGIGSGIVYGVTIGTCCQWFPKCRGLICGIVVSGFGLSSFLFDIVQMFMIRDVEIDWIPFSYIIIGAICIIVQFIGSLMLTDPKEISSEPMIANLDASTVLSDLPYNNKWTDIRLKPHQLYFELDFWLLWITYALLSSCFTLIISTNKIFGDTFNITDERPYYYLSSISMVGTFANAIGRIVWGILIDKYVYKKVMLILTISLIFFFGTFYFCHLLNARNTNNVGVLVFYLIWTLGLYAIPSGIFSIFPYICSHLFGMKHFITNYGMLFTAYSFGGLITGVIVTFGSHSMLGMCIAGSLMSGVSSLLTLLFRGKSLVHRKNLFD